jgi:two-component system sensor histidine kinase DesK
LTVEDDGIGMENGRSYVYGNGLLGMKERLEFVNGSLELSPAGEWYPRDEVNGDGRIGTKVWIKVPHALAGSGRRRGR